MNQPGATRLTRWFVTGLAVAFISAPVSAPVVQGVGATAVAQGASPESTRVQDITFDAIKFEMKEPKSRKFKRSMLTEKIEKLEGKPIRIRGYILPSFKQKDITQFILVRDNMECCFGPGAALYDCIVVEMEGGKAIEYTIRPVAVEGKFSVNEITGPDGVHLAIYRMVAKSVE